jgi:hypothetical protein
MTDSVAPAPAPTATPAPAPAPTATPALAPAPTATPAPAPASTPFDFSKVGLTEQNQAIVANKKFSDINALVEWGYNAEKFIGADPKNLIKLPANTMDTEAMRPIMERLGAGKGPEDYKFEIPKNVDGTDGDSTFANEAAKWFHANQVPVSAAQEIVKAHNKFVAETLKNIETARITKFTMDETTLKTEWGALYDTNVGLAQNAARSLGLSEEMIDALQEKIGHAAVMKWAYSVGRKITGTGDFHTGDGGVGFNGMSPAMAIQRISELKSDIEWTKRYASGGTKERKEMDRLHEIAYPAPKK